MRRKVLFKSKEVQLEKIDITIGNCHTTKYREISMKEGELEVRELKQFPDWYVRELKLQILLDGKH